MKVAILLINEDRHTDGNFIYNVIPNLMEGGGGRRTVRIGSRTDGHTDVHIEVLPTYKSINKYINRQMKEYINKQMNVQTNKCIKKQ